MKAGDARVAWDGKDQEGNEMQDGLYTFVVAARGPEGELLQTETFMSRLVTGVRFRDDGPVLLAGKEEVPLAAVKEIRALDELEEVEAEEGMEESVEEESVEPEDSSPAS
jgi:flagellar hook assembly protein FlgD